MNMIIESPYMPRKHALAFHGRAQRFAINVWHRRAGKTVACINDMIDKAVQNPLPMPRYSYIAPLYKQAKSVAWNYLKFYSQPIAAKVMESELSVTLKTGQRIQLFGADNPDALRGVYNDGVILDEYGDMQPRLFGEVIVPTLTDRMGWAAFIGTPKGPNHFKELWDDSQGDEAWYTQMLKASQSGVISKTELEMIKKMPGMDEESYLQEFECDFHAAVRGSYYGKILNAIEATNFGCFPFDPEYSVLTAWDIGYTDDTSIWFFQVRGNDIIIIDFFTGAGYSVDDIVAMLHDKAYPYAGDGFFLPHDAKNKSFQTGKSTVELLDGHDIHCLNQLIPNLSFQDGIQAARSTLPKTFFNIANNDVKYGLNALRMYQREWDDKNRRFKDSHKHDWSSNPADAYRMLALSMTKLRAKKEYKNTQGQRIQVVRTINPKIMNLDNLHADRKLRMSARRGRI